MPALSLLLSFAFSCSIIAIGLCGGNVDIDVTYKPEKCHTKAKEQDFLTVHYTSRYDDGEAISSTYDRGVPVEIQLGTRMISAGMDEGLKGVCEGEKRTLTMPAYLGLFDEQKVASGEKRKIVYELEVVSLSNKITLNTFKYLDLNGDGQISSEEGEKLVKMFMKFLSLDIPFLDEKMLVSFFLSLHDKNNDSLISAEEFMNAINMGDINNLMGSFQGDKDDHDEL